MQNEIGGNSHLKRQRNNEVDKRPIVLIVQALYLMFTSNSYPVKFFNSVLGKFLNKPYTASISDDGEEAETHCVLLKVPFLGK